MWGVMSLPSHFIYTSLLSHFTLHCLHTSLPSHFILPSHFTHSLLYVESNFTAFTLHTAFTAFTLHTAFTAFTLHCLHTSHTLTALRGECFHCLVFCFNTHRGSEPPHHVRHEPQEELLISWQQARQRACLTATLRVLATSSPPPAFNAAAAAAAAAAAWRAWRAWLVPPTCVLLLLM